jgi:predicted nuclease with TOPRIM domain
MNDKLNKNSNEQNNKINKDNNKIINTGNEDIKIKEDKKYSELLNKLNEEKSKNKKLMEQLSNEQKKVKELNDKIKLYENNDNEKKIKKLEETINSLNSKINDLKNNSDKDKAENINSGEEIVALFFTSIEQDVHRPISCKKTDTFVRIEEKIYNEYPQYKEYNTYLTVNGNAIKRFKTLEENKIKDGNTIIINIYDE